ncbi:MAG: hypothetical protein ACOC1P_00680 [Minisyncoccales bacterium]
MKIWYLGRKAKDDYNFLEELQKRHDNLSVEINKAIVRLKNQGHFMGKDTRSKMVTEVHVPNSEKIRNKNSTEYRGIKKVPTLRLDHRITMKMIRAKRKIVSKIIHDKDHIDNAFAHLAMICKEFINTSRVIRQVELHKGEILRNTILALRHDDNKIEYY